MSKLMLHMGRPLAFVLLKDERILVFSPLLCALRSFPKRFTRRPTRHSRGLLLPPFAPRIFHQPTNGQELERTKRLRVHTGKHAVIKIDS